MEYQQKNIAKIIKLVQHKESVSSINRENINLKILVGLAGIAAVASFLTTDGLQHTEETMRKIAEGNFFEDILIYLQLSAPSTVSGGITALSIYHLIGNILRKTKLEEKIAKLESDMGAKNADAVDNFRSLSDEVVDRISKGR